MNKRKTIRFIAVGAAIAALYAGATLLLAPISYGPVQFRLSEVLTTLCIFTPAAIPGLTIGCFLGNLASPFGWMDWVFGSFATLLAAVTGRQLRNVRLAGIPWLSLLMPVIFNAVIIGAELTFFQPDKSASLSVFIFNGASVGIGELAVCVIGGAIFVKVIEKSNSLKNALS